MNNVYSSISLDDGKSYTCRLKGKVLKGSNEYNPVAVGDIAIGDSYSENEALITSIEERRSGFTRWNVKASLDYRGQSRSDSHSPLQCLTSFQTSFCRQGNSIQLGMRHPSYYE